MDGLREGRDGSPTIPKEAGDYAGIVQAGRVGVVLLARTAKRQILGERRQGKFKIVGDTRDMRADRHGLFQ